MIKGTREQVIAELYRCFPAVYRGPQEAPEYFFAPTIGSFEEQIKDKTGPGNVKFFHLNPKNGGLSLEQEDFEIIM